MRVQSFPPLVDRRATTLILGSMPGVASLRAQQYYAHPHNQFWKIMGTLCGAGMTLPYSQRLEALQHAGLALWDVLHSCVRPGSLDTAIELEGAVANDLPGLLAAHPRIVRVCCNGGLAYATLRQRFGAQLAQRFAYLTLQRLPSTSPANASWSYARKLAAWRAALALSRA